MSSTAPWSRFEPASPSPSEMPSGRSASVTFPSVDVSVVTLLARISWPSSDSRPADASITLALTRLSVPTKEATNAVAGKL